MEFELINGPLLVLGLGTCLTIVLLGLLFYTIKEDVKEKKRNEEQPMKPKKVV